MRKITKLTSEQEAAIPGWVDKWIAEGLRTDEADWEKAEQGIRECYAHAGIPFPTSGITRVQSPLVGAVAASILNTPEAVSETVYGAVDRAFGEGGVGERVGRAIYEIVRAEVYEAVGGIVRETVYEAIYGAVRKTVYKAVYETVRETVHETVDEAVYEAVSETVQEAVYGAVRETVYETVTEAVGGGGNVNLNWHTWFGGQFWVAWQAYETFFRDICGLKLPTDRQAISYEMVQTSCNCWWPNRHFVFVCNRPKFIGRNTQGRLHATDRMAIEYRDGWGLWVLNGVQVPRGVVITPANELDPTLIMTERNAEVRREIVRKIGIERLLTKLKAKVLDKSGDYELLQLPKIEGMAIVPTYLKMRNPSLGVWHVEGVPPTVKTVQQALNARAGKLLSAGDWMPEQLT